ncbi:MAG: Gfo/Idh/MocA family oxidoreductase [Anaerolineae bacterium]|nr:Gfo/Idh/MocA family oxidoreductase [Anaerolineae bacterium]
MRKARIGIIGVGWWGTVGHLEPLSKDPKAEIVAVYSRTEDKAKQRAEQYHVSRYYTDYRQLIDECNLDGVIIATTPNVHYEQARYALEHGLHVLMEKPFVLQSSQAEELAELAKAKGKLLGVCHPLLFHPALQEAARYLRDGSLGKLFLISALFSQRVYELYKGQVENAFKASGREEPLPNATSYSDPSIAGGGEGHTQASHLVGAVLWLTQLTPAEVFAHMDNLDTPLDVVDTFSVRFQEGALASMAANGLLPAGVFQMHVHIQGERGLLHLDVLGRSAFVLLAGEKEPRKFNLAENPPFPLRDQVPRNFVRAILGEEKLLVGAQIAVNEVKILDAAYQSARLGHPVAIK